MLAAAFLSFPAAMARRTFLAVGFIALFGCLIILAVSYGRTARPGCRGLAGVALVATGLGWYRCYRRRRYGGLGWHRGRGYGLSDRPHRPGHAAHGRRRCTRLPDLTRDDVGSLLAKLAHSATGFVCLAAGLALTGPSRPDRPRAARHGSRTACRHAAVRPVPARPYPKRYGDQAQLGPGPRQPPTRRRPRPAADLAGHSRRGDQPWPMPGAGGGGGRLG